MRHGSLRIFGAEAPCYRPEKKVDPVSRMIAHFSAQLGGGGHIAARRLHEALCREGIASHFYYGTGESEDPSYTPVFQNRSFLRRNIEAIARSRWNRQLADDGYVVSSRATRKTRLPVDRETPTVINLHDVARWLDLPSFFDSLPIGIPIVWSLHTLVTVTGGCIYPGACDGFAKQCGNCPQLQRPSPRDLTNRDFKLKERWYRQLNLHLVGNSNWTTSQAQRSTLAKYTRSIRTIHYGLNVEHFKPVDKVIARTALGITGDNFVIGFACSDFSERRKGAHLLMEALKSLPSKETMLLVFGSGLWPRDATNVKTITLGSIGSPRLQSLYYSALDVFAMPTQIETFGNVAMEAMACETPVVAFSAGGLADVVTDGETGLLESEIGSVAGLARMLRWMRKHPVERIAMGVTARKQVVEKFSDSLMASRYIKLYNELVAVETRPALSK